MNNLETEIIKTTLDEVITNLGDSSSNQEFYENFVKTLFFYNVYDSTIILVTENTFSKQVLLKDFLPKIAFEFNKKIKSNYVFNIITKNERNSFVSGITNDFSSFSKPICHENLKRNLRFDNYYVSNFNNNAVAAAKSIGENNFLNPLFVCGGVGLGKTHLLHAVGNDFAIRFPNKSIKYISADDFSREIYLAFGNDDKYAIEKMKDKYESIDLLMVDDVQMLAKRDKINEVLFNIFNNNIAKDKIIIWCSDKNPDLLMGFDDRMKSRFHSGLFVTIEKPDLVCIKNLIVTKLKEINPNYFLSDDCVNYLTHRNKGDIRRLEGDLHQIVFYANNNFLAKEPISLEILQTIFNSNNMKEKKEFGFSVDPNIVINQICTAYGVKDDLVKSKSRLKFLTAPRNVCMYVLRNRYNLTFAQIGGCFSNRSHSTVMEAIEKIGSMIKKDEALNVFIDNICKKI